MTPKIRCFELSIEEREKRFMGHSEIPFLSPEGHFSLGVPGTQRERWVSLAVDNFGSGLTPL